MSKETKEKVKKPFYKRIWVWIIVIIFIAAVSSSGKNESENSSEDSSSAISSSKESFSPDPESPLSDLDITFYKEFRNDTTGKWRKALVSTDMQIQDYAVDYYKTYFNADDEVHVIYNFSSNTVNCLKIYGDELYISVTDYVDGEEHDAKAACAGTFLCEYHINVDSGEITYNSLED